jgi:hypothetical protein
MKFLTSIFTLVLMFFSFSAFASDPIKDLVGVTVPVNVDGSAPNVEEVKQAIISACRKRGWTPTITGANQITASITVRSKHSAEVEISYTEKDYSIIYKSSQELDYNEKKRKIHRNYNKWVAMLSSSIQREFGVRAQGY